MGSGTVSCATMYTFYGKLTLYRGNCQPRLPASHLLVRKEGPNKGRWFYTCQEPKESACRFFLWDDAAHSREMGAVLQNSRSESQPSNISADTTEATASIDRTSVNGHIAASNKWMADLARKDEEEFGDWPLSPEGELKVAGVIGEASMHSSSTPETPRKAIKNAALETPGSKRKREGVWPSPQTSTADDVFAIPGMSRSKGGMWDGTGRPGLLSPSATPTPDRYRNANKGSGLTEESSPDYDITEEIMSLLRDQSLDEATSSKVRQVLNKYALKTLGIAKGRDMTRLALKGKDTKIAELQQRITALETERDMDRVVIRHFRSDMAESVSKQGSGGRGRGCVS